MFRLSCAGPNCQMRTYNFSDEQSRLAKSNYVVSFHKFPADPARRKAWINAAQQTDWKPSDSSCLCSLHFRDDCFNENNQLHDHAVPTIFFNDFRAYIKSIVKNIQLEVNLESEASDDNEDVLSKSLKNLSPAVSDIEEIIEYDIAVSDDDFEIECEEVITEEDCIDAITEEDYKEPISSTSTSDNNSTNLISKPVKINSDSVCKPSSKKSNVVVDQENTPSKNVVNIDVAKEAYEVDKNAPKNVSNVQNINASASNKIISNLTSDALPEFKNLKRKEVPSELPETGQKLFSMIKNDSSNKFSVMQPASKNLVFQLLNIVKLANAQNTSTSVTEGSIPNTYIITTKQENEDPNWKGKITAMETSEIVTMIMNTVKTIKDGVFQKTEDISIICGNPAIFLIKNIIVKNFDQSMNSVYVITNENLLPYLLQLSTRINSSTNSVRSTSNKLPKSTAITNVNNPILSSQSKIISPIIPTTSQVRSSSILSTTMSSVRAQRKLLPKPVNETSQIFKSSTLNMNSVRQNLTPQSVKSIATPQMLKSIVLSDMNSVQQNLTPRQSITATSLNNKSSPINTSILQQKLTNFQQMSEKTNNMSNVSTSLKNVSSPLRTQSNLGQSRMKLNSTPATQARSITKPQINSNLNSKSQSTYTVSGTLPVVDSTMIGNVGQPALKLNSSSSSIASTPSASNTPISRSSSQSFGVKYVSSPMIASTTSASNTQIGKGSFQSFGVKYGVVPKKSIDPPVYTIDDDDYDSAPREITISKSISQKRELEHEPASELEPKKKINDPEYLEKQKNDIQNLERSIIRKETEIIALRKKIQKLKKRYNTVKNPADAKTDEQMVEDMLKKYLDQDAVQFFVGQMKVSGKTYTQFRWTEEDKLFALSLLYKNPVEYHILFQRFTLPSDKTLNKFVARIKKAEMDVMK